MPVSGAGRRGILVVGECPTEEDDYRGEHFSGEIGKRLRSVFSNAGVDLDQDCWLTYANVCKTPDNRNTTPDEVDYCRPVLNKTIRDLSPSHIIPLGISAIRSVIGPAWKDGVGEIALWPGWHIPMQRHNAWVTPNYAVQDAYGTYKDKQMQVPIRVWFERYLYHALQLTGRPWAAVPDYKKAVKILMDPEDVKKTLRRFIEAGGAVAFDYETTRIKPDWNNSEIVSCAVCWRGKETVAYPWVGAAVDATSELLLSNLPKLGANAKFEERWTRAKLGHPVNNWQWDCMDNAHLLDNRDNCTSVKFQGFVRRGVEPWNTHIEPYLEAENPDGTNKIREVDLQSLLIYNGIDALVEFEVAVDQRKELKARVNL
jgi:hypothetical protein